MLSTMDSVVLVSQPWEIVIESVKLTFTLQYRLVGHASQNSSELRMLIVLCGYQKHVTNSKYEIICCNSQSIFMLS